MALNKFLYYYYYYYYCIIKLYTSITGDPCPFHNFKRKVDLGFDVFFSKTIKKCTVVLALLQLNPGNILIYHD